MSFDIFFQPARFTVGKAEPLGANDAQAVQDVLRKANADGPGQTECYVVEFAEGGGAEIYGSDLAKGCMVVLRGMTPRLTQFLFDLLAAAKWVMLPIMENSVAIATSLDHVFDAPDGFPKVVECELGVFLRDGVDAWQRYRDQVIGGC